MDKKEFDKLLKIGGFNTKKEFANLFELNPKSVNNWGTSQNIPYWVESWLKNYIELNKKQEQEQVIKAGDWVLCTDLDILEGRINPKDYNLNKKQDATNPKHYDLKIKPIDFIEANELDFNIGNVVKYVSRYKGKSGLEDLKKARWYLDREIERLENG